MPQNSSQPSAEAVERARKYLESCGVSPDIHWGNEGEPGYFTLAELLANFLAAQCAERDRQIEQLTDDRETANAHALIAIARAEAAERQRDEALAKLAVRPEVSASIFVRVTKQRDEALAQNEQQFSKGKDYALHLLRMLADGPQRGAAWNAIHEEDSEIADVYHELTKRGDEARDALRKAIRLIPVEFDREDDGRWIAEMALPGVMVYGDSQEEAANKVRELAERVLSDTGGKQ